jgi:protein gp37
MSKIEWTNKTWNPIIGCSHASKGCDNCYAEKMAGRLSNMKHTHSSYSKVVKWGQHPKTDMYYGLQKWNGQTKFVEKRLIDPYGYKKGTMVFVCSMGDLFHETVKEEWIDKVFEVITETPNIIYQVLTKRPKKAYLYFSNKEVPYNVWFGITAENQENLEARLPYLNKINADTRFVSFEPLLGPIDLFKLDHEYINWIIVGGETGPKSRPTHPNWINSIVLFCTDLKVPLYFKSWGDYYTKSLIFFNKKSAPMFRMFRSKTEWVNKAQTWVRGGKCVSLDGIQMNSGRDFNVCDYPVAIMDRVGKKKSGNTICGKKYEQFPS